MISIFLAILYPIAIQYERGGWWRVLAPLLILALIVDIIANYTELALLTWDWPQRGEYTFSQRLTRLRYYGDWRGNIARSVIPYLDYFDPDGHHI